jgi:hypothetical protein
VSSGWTFVAHSEVHIAVAVVATALRLFGRYCSSPSNLSL